MTVLELIKGSMRLVGGLGVGRGIEGAGSIAVDCLFHLNAMVQSWNLERCFIHKIVEYTFADVLAGAATFAVTPTPIRVESARWVDGDTSSPIEVVNYERWIRVNRNDFAATGTPEHLYIDGASLGHLWPIPDAAGDVIIGIWSPVAALAAADVLALPPGYERALMFGLACEIASIFPDTSISQYVLDTAADAKAAIKRLNLPSPVLDCDPALVGQYYL